MINIALDVETTKLPYIFSWQKESYLVMLSLVDETGWKKSWLFNHDQFDPSSVDQNVVIEEIRDEINKSDRIIGQNLKFDLGWLNQLSISYENKLLYCTKYADYMLNGCKKIGYHLNDIAKRWGVKLKDDRVKMYWDSGYETSEIPLEILVPYCEDDCFNTLSIFQRQMVEIKKQDLVTAVSLGNRMGGLLADIEFTGIKANKELGMALVAEIQQQLDTIDVGLAELLGDIKLSSGDELSAALFGGVIKRKGSETVQRKLKSGEVKEYERTCIIETHIDGAGFKPIKGSELKKEGYYSTGKDIIEQLGARTKEQKELKKLLLARSAVAKSLESLWGENGTGILNRIEADGRIHPKYNQTVTSTGRLSSSDPNGQNLPREGTSPIKRVFIPRYDMIMSADASQLEWRVATDLSGDITMIKEIWEGSDVHGENAVNFFGDMSFRKVAKFFTFRMIYGGTAYGFYMDNKMPDFSKKRWGKIVGDFSKKYHGLIEWQNDNIRTVNDKGVLFIPSGRFFAFRSFEGSFNVRHIKNYPVQGFSYDIISLVMLIIKRRMIQGGFKSLMIAQVHDEVVFDMVKEEIRPLGKICLETFEAIPQLMKAYWGFQSKIPYAGAIKVGNDYEAMVEYDREVFIN